MTRYYKDGIEKTFAEIKSMNKEVVFSTPEQLGWEVILPSPKPITTDLQKAVYSGSTVLDGTRVETYTIVDLFQDIVNEDGTITTKEELEAAYLAELKKAELNSYKMEARTIIRDISNGGKDIEDDLVDTKMVLQFALYAIVDIYNQLTDEQKSSLKYRDNLAMFAPMLQDPSNKLRVDVEPDQVAKIAKILTDEVKFAQIVDEEYLSKAKQ